MKIANAPCSWGVLEFELEGQALGFEQVLNEIAETGYKGTELGDWGFMPTEPEALRSEVGKRSLSLLGAFVPVSLSQESAHADGIKEALKVAGLMYGAGFKDAFIVLADNNGSVEYRTKNAGRINGEGGLSPAEMSIFASGVEKIAKAVKEKYDMRMVFHHHAAGYIETPNEIETLLQLTNPELVGLCFDTGHYKFGGGADPLDFMKRHWQRIWHVHFKDYSGHVKSLSAMNKWDYFESVKNGIFCELGKGDVDFKVIKNFLEEQNYNGWIVVEQDVLPGMGNPKQCAENNRMYLQTIGL